MKVFHCVEEFNYLLVVVILVAVLLLGHGGGLEMVEVRLGLITFIFGYIAFDIVSTISLKYSLGILWHFHSVNLNTLCDMP